jgi:hypothetical protein
LLTSFKRFITSTLQNQTEETSGYVVSLLSSIIFLAGKTIGLQEHVNWLLYFAVIALIYGFLVFLNSLAKSFIESGLGKLLVSGALVIGSGVSLALARQTINSELQVPSSAYPITQSILAVLYAPLTLSICLALSGVFFLMVGVVLSFMPFKVVSMKSLLVNWWNEAFTAKEIVINVIRLLGLIAVISVAINFAKQSDWYTDTLASFTHWFAYSFESEEYSYCTLKFGERIAYLSNNRVVITTKDVNDEYLYEIRSCL